MSAKLIQTLIRRLLTINFYVVAFGRGCTTDVTPEDNEVSAECMHIHRQPCSTPLFRYLLLGRTYRSHSPAWIRLFHHCHCVVLCTIDTSDARTGARYYKWQKGWHIYFHRFFITVHSITSYFRRGRFLHFSCTVFEEMYMRMKNYTSTSAPARKVFLVD